MPEVFQRFLPGGYLGFDKEGCPVWYHPFAWYSFDFIGGLKSDTLENNLKLFFYLNERHLQRGRENGKRLGKAIEKGSLICDMKDCPISMVWNKQVKQALFMGIKQYEANYPEQLKKLYIINFSPMLILLYKMAKAYFDNDVFNKIQISGTEGYQEALLEDIDADVLPAFLGGTRVDPDGDPRCPSVIKPGGLIDPKYYMKNTRHKFSDKKDVKTIVVGAQSEVFIDVDVTTSGSLLQWEFLTVNHDIGVGLQYRPPGSNYNFTEQLMPSERADSHQVPKRLDYQCSRPGIYVIQFDNKYSWIRQKIVKYRVKVCPPL